MNFTFDRVLLPAELLDLGLTLTNVVRSCVPHDKPADSKGEARWGNKPAPELIIGHAETIAARSNPI